VERASFLNRFNITLAIVTTRCARACVSTGRFVRKEEREKDGARRLRPSRATTTKRFDKKVEFKMTNSLENDRPRPRGRARKPASTSTSNSGRSIFFFSGPGRARFSLRTRPPSSAPPLLLLRAVRPAGRPVACQPASGRVSLGRSGLATQNVFVVLYAYFVRRRKTVVVWDDDDDDDEPVRPPPPQAVVVSRTPTYRNERNSESLFFVATLAVVEKNPSFPKKRQRLFSFLCGQSEEASEERREEVWWCARPTMAVPWLRRLLLRRSFLRSLGSLYCTIPASSSS